MNEVIQINVGPEVTLPSGLIATCEPISGEDQDTLSNKSKVQTGEAIDELISKKVKFNGIYYTTSQAREMLVGDKSAISIHLRRLSFGDEVNLNLECPECKKKYDTQFILSDNECIIQPYKNGNEKRIRVNVEYSLTYQGKTEMVSRCIELSLMTGLQTSRILRLGNNVKLTDLLSVREPVEIILQDGKEERKMLNIRMESALFISRLAAAIKEYEPDMSNLIINSTCSYCNTIQQNNLIGTASFLFPHVI